MANRAYLNHSKFDHDYSSCIEEIDGQKITIAASSYSVPLLWFGLFRLEDLQAKETEIEKQIYRELVPFAEKEKAIKQLYASLGKFDALFIELGSLAEHIEYLSKIILSVRGDYVSVDLQEIADLEKPEEFYSQIEFVLKYLSGENLENVKDIFVDLSNIDDKRKFSSPQGWFEGADLETRDDQNLSLLGYSW